VIDGVAAHQADAVAVRASIRQPSTFSS
jgi:hypothetical protein